MSRGSLSFEWRTYMRWTILRAFSPFHHSSPTGSYSSTFSSLHPVNSIPYHIFKFSIKLFDICPYKVRYQSSVLSLLMISHCVPLIFVAKWLKYILFATSLCNLFPTLFLLLKPGCVTLSFTVKLVSIVSTYSGMQILVLVEMVFVFVKSSHLFRVSYIFDHRLNL